ncbi:twin-arginine translocase subunit TatC [Fredinandcohnia quinoae]|uniref:Sec-independent protein translocase protein TatC n=1 Tax=Fredinandcohnia quinoae TaxID=2918902 RepID=A0AAW5E9I2_9BACI|nr:twin-arginine translocase subunit TatC [Fredinandcohnia sp. SECRCQ15]MCH1626691.1 twin-arginine translocase subunit TatC [Fredinandcohnia sp. SECRCQ15]
MVDDLQTEVKSEETTIEHLSDLRKALIKSTIFFVVMFGVIIFYMPKILPLLTNDYKIVLLGPLDVVRFYTGVGGALGLGLTAPFLCFQIWKFVKPALAPSESRIALTYVPFILMSFIIGVTFGYFVVFQILFEFLMGIGQSSFDMIVTAREYFSFMLISTISLGLLFELPISMVFLTSLGIVTPEKLKTTRKYSYICLGLISALITPPDFISQLVVLVPLIILYELGILLSTFTYKKKIANQVKLA